jgi:hypothetical protein
MNVARIAFVTLALAPSTSAPALARTAQEVVPPQPEALQAADLELHPCTPRASNIEELFDTLQGLYRRQLLVESEEGSQLNRVSNMTRLGNSVILYDTPDQVQRILAALEQLDEVAIASETLDAGDPSGTADPREAIVVAEYGPRFVDLPTVQSILAPFTRTVRHWDEQGKMYEQENLSFVVERSTVVMRDTSAHIAQMTELLGKLDRPAPQVMLTAQLLLAKADGSNAGLPPELVQNLGKLVGYERFEAVATSTLRTSVGGVEQQVALQLSTNTELYELSILSSAFDAKTGALTIRECRLDQLSSPGGRLFSTACVIGANEFTVLGSSGPTPLFAVVRMVPLALE